MVKIICISDSLVRTGVCAVDDIVEIVDGDKVQTGKGTSYEYFKVIEVDGLTVEEVRSEIESNLPEIRRTKESDGKIVEEWKVNGEWVEIKSRPKYNVSMKDLTEQDKVTLQSGIASKETKLSVFSKTVSKIKEENPKIEIIR